ncbi:MAG: glycosyl transferase family protein [Pseudonocardiales bacterium]|nr:glycosyl transferase family protein [Pseudonocardiales bacterium]
MTATIETAEPAWVALPSRPAPDSTGPVLDLVVPVHNEELALERSVRRLRHYLDQDFPLPARITIVDNASTDSTAAIAARLAATMAGVRFMRIEEKGRGRALRAAWSVTDAQVVAYTDVDLSTDLSALAPMVTAIVSGHSDLAIGSRLHGSARVTRGPKREFISRSYNLLLRTTLSARFTDAQCGFKAVRADLAKSMLPVIEDEGWFFDTELLVLAERSGLRILEIPVDWVDDPDSRVDIVPTAIADLKGVVRLARGLLNGSIRHRLADQVGGRERGFGRQLGRFAIIGAISTVAYLGLFALLRGSLGAQWANFTALLVTAIANTAVNRRVTFAVDGRGRPARDHAVGLVAFGIGLAVTTGSLRILDAVHPGAGRVSEVLVLLGASAVATVFRFLALRAVLVHSTR